MARLGQGETQTYTQERAGAPNPVLRTVLADTTSTGYEVVDGNGVSVWKAGGAGAVGATKANFISGQGATRTLVAYESGSTCLFDRAAGIVYTLPVPAVGMFFDFITTVTITSNNATVITDAGTTFVLGFVAMGISAAATSLYATANGTSHIKIQSNGSTTGGILGSQFRFTCVSATVWNVTGFVSATATMATPFA